MIDYLVNILPGFNEQSPSRAEAISQLQKSEESGVRTIIAAPSFRLNKDNVVPSDIKESVDELNKQAQEHSLSIKVVPGQSIYIDDDLPRAFTDGELQTINDSQYMLLLLDGETIHPRIHDIMYNLQLAGVRPIIAHPERHKEIIEQPEILYRLVKGGALAQLNASSFTGRVSGYTRKFSEQLIENRLVHFLMSSTLNTKSRSSDYLKAFHVLERQGDGSNAQYFKQNIDRMMKDYNIYVEPPVRVKKKKYMGLF